MDKQSLSEKLDISPAKKTIAVAASALVILAATWASAAAATKSAAPKGGQSIEIGAGGTAASIGAPDMSTSAISSMPTYCCGGSSSGAQGLTTYGQASVKGQGTAARDAAIAKAIADATEQAKAAASAAGITLGSIIDMQVSAPYFAYDGGIAVSNGATATKGGPIPPSTPVGMETGTSTGVSYVGSASSGGGGASSGGSMGVSPPCPAGAPCVSPVPMPVETFASVTITWAIN
jgi:hypothetical protein